ncbi:hypothetical protein [Saccharopolyspora erythraea]|uniref:hypothetical protein n=1 Tax=Saccharopolyspora erythraea TaxID=1836 RepID=UPI001F5C43D2|nr:hypothetical protein [Saccharopolyspora erythraea]
MISSPKDPLIGGLSGAPRRIELEGAAAVMTASKVPVHGVVTVLYACPLTDAQLRDAEVSDLARSSPWSTAPHPARCWDHWNKGWPVLARVRRAELRPAPLHGPGPGQSRRTIGHSCRHRGRDTSAEPPPVHPVEIEPDAIWPN